MVAERFSDSPFIPLSHISTAAANALVLHTGACRVKKIHAYNNGNSVAMLRVYDLSQAPVPGSSAPEPMLRLALPPGSGFVDVSDKHGWPFANGIAITITGGMGDDDDTEVAADQVTVNIGAVVRD